MQTNVGFAGKTLVVGLNWSVIAKSGPGRKKDISKACVDSGFTLGVTVDGPELAALGLCAKKVEFPSAAAMLAAANGLALKKREFGDTQTSANWIMVEQLKSGDKAGSYWMCAISDGVPVPGTDIIEDLTVTSAKLAELVEILENVEIYSVEPDILEYVAEASPSFEKSFAELTAEVSNTKNMRPQKIVGVPDWFYLLVVAVVAVVAIGAGASWYSEQQAQKAKLAQLQLRQAQATKIAEEDALRKDQTYHRLDEAAKKQEIDRVGEALAHSPVEIVKEWSRVANALPLNHGGWNMDNMVCDLKACVVSLSRDEALGTNKSLREVIPTAEFTEAGSASYVIPLGPMGVRNVSMGELSDWSSFALSVGTSLQELKMSGLVDASLGARKELTYRPPPLTAANVGPGAVVGAAQNAASAMGGNQASQQPPRPIGVLNGPFTVKGTSVWQLNDAADYFTSMEFAVSTLKVDFAHSIATDAAWTIQGSYYLRSAGGLSVDAPSGLASAGSVKNGMLPQGVGPMPPNNQPLQAMPAGMGTK